MLFSEVYGTYYHVLTKLLESAVDGTLTEESMNEIIRRFGFEESILTIPDALKRQVWPLLQADYSTPLAHAPTMPLTTLQKRWLKALLDDPRIKLFDPPVEGLEDVEPLYPADALIYYDRYNDSDPFEDPAYIERFRCILSAIRERRWLRIRFIGQNGFPHARKCIPYQLEYSAKDDKFRLITANRGKSISINLARIQQCVPLEPYGEEALHPKPMKKRVLVLELTDVRNALERALLHFSHLQKETERIDENRYRITLHYEQKDEAEILIRVLSFGPALKVIAPEDFARKLVERLKKQKKLRMQT